MQKLFIALVFAAAIAALLWWLHQPLDHPLGEGDAPAAASATAPPPVQPPAPPGAQPAAPVAANVSSEPPRRPPAPPSPLPRIKVAAEAEGIRIARYEEQPGAAVIEVQWVSDVVTQGTDFVDVLRRQGIIRDFDLLGAPYRQFMSADGRPTKSVTFKIRF